MSWYRLKWRDEIAKVEWSTRWSTRYHSCSCTKRIRESLNSCKNTATTWAARWNLFFLTRILTILIKSLFFYTFIYRWTNFILACSDLINYQSWYILISHVVNYLIVDALGSHLISCKDCAALSRNCIVLMSLLEWRSYPFPLPLPPLLIQSKRGQYQHWKVLGNANRRHSGLKQFSPHRRSSDSCFENSHCYSPEVKRWSVEVSLWERKGIAEV